MRRPHVDRACGGKIRSPGPHRAWPRMATKQMVHIDDMMADQTYVSDPLRIAVVKLGGVRTLLAVPMLKDDELIGAIVIYRQEVRPFTDKQIELVRTSPRRPSSPSRIRGCSTSCASAPDSQSLEQQTATAEVLQGHQPLAWRAADRCSDDAGESRCTSLRGELRHASTARRTMRSVVAAMLRRAARVRASMQDSIRLSPSAAFARSVVRYSKAGRSHSPTSRADPDYTRASQASSWAASALCSAVPMLKDGELIGAIVIYAPGGAAVHRQADRAGRATSPTQAVIAIENTRLLNELRESACSSRPPPPTCSRSSAARPSTCKRCSIRWSQSAARLCEADRRR